MNNPYENCPVLSTESFTLRLTEVGDSKDLFACYHDKKAIELMNDDNCDFGFYTETEEKMAETIDYWISFYKQGFFIRFAIVDKRTQKAIGTIEGFGGETAVARVDICSEYETDKYLAELFDVMRTNFKEIFQNKFLVTKAIPAAVQRQKTLKKCGWQYIGDYKGYNDYYKIECK